MPARPLRIVRELLLLVRAVVALRRLEGSLRRHGFAETHARAHERGAELSTEPPSVADAERMASLVAAAARIARVRCLPRSLLLYSWLLRAGAPVRFCIGVCRSPGGLRAHAWVEWSPSSGEPVPLGERSDVRGQFALLRSGTNEADGLTAADFPAS